LVGYTNAGKSSLFNKLTGASGYAADRLFATLDPLVRRIHLTGIGPVVLTDTVGFVRELPHELIAAFRATLEQVVDADLLLHVVDVRPEQREERISTVDQVISSLGAERVPKLVVFNKVNLLGTEVDFGGSRVEGEDESDRLGVSAHTGSGLEELKARIARILQPEQAFARLILSPTSGRLRAELYALGVVEKESFEDSGDSLVEVAMPIGRLQRLLSAEAQARIVVAGQTAHP
jgi:GTP-binding protein HflX